MDKIKNVSGIVKTKVGEALHNPYVMAILKIVLILYAAQIAPTLPVVVQNTFKNTFVKIICVASIAYFAEVDFQLAIILAIIFVLSTNLLSNRSIFESFDAIDASQTIANYNVDPSKYTTLLDKPSVITKSTLIESSSDNYPGCDNVKMNDLLELFNGDQLKLQETVRYAIEELLTKLPKDSDATTKLNIISKAIGLPYNITLNDKNAPLIATILLNNGFKVSDSCQQPN